MTRKVMVAVFLTVVVVLGLRMGFADAAAGSQSDPDDTTGLDIKSVSHANDDVNVTFGFDAFEAFTADSVFRIRWDFDFNGDDVAGDACLIVQPNGSGFRGEVFGDNCGSAGAGTSDATTPTSDRLQIVFPISVLRDAGLQSSATQYKYKVRSTDRLGNNDSAPDTGLITHALAGGASASPSPSASASASPSTSPSSSPSHSPAASSAASSATPLTSATPCPSRSPTPTPAVTSTPQATIAPAASATATPTSTVFVNTNPCTTSTTGSILPASLTTSSSASDPTNTLPHTGASVLTLLAIAAGLILFGVELFVRKERMTNA